MPTKPETKPDPKTEPKPDPKTENKAQQKPTNGTPTVPPRGKVADKLPSIARGRNNDLADLWAPEIEKCIKEGLTGQWVAFGSREHPVDQNVANQLRKSFVLDFITDESPDVQKGTAMRDTFKGKDGIRYGTVWIMIPEKLERA